MDYFFSQILKDLQDRISKEVPEITFIDQDSGQLGQTGEHEKPPLPYPACLIDFPNSDYSNLSGGAQLGAVSITFQLIFDTYNKAPEDVIMKDLEYLEVEQKLHKALQKWHLDYFSPLIRTNVKSQNTIGLRVRILTYTTEYEDYCPIDEEYKKVEFSFKRKIKN